MYMMLLPIHLKQKFPELQSSHTWHCCTYHNGSTRKGRIRVSCIFAFPVCRDWPRMRPAAVPLLMSMVMFMLLWSPFVAWCYLKGGGLLWHIFHLCLSTFRTIPPSLISFPIIVICPCSLFLSVLFMNGTLENINKEYSGFEWLHLCLHLW